MLIRCGLPAQIQGQGRHGLYTVLPFWANVAEGGDRALGCSAQLGVSMEKYRFNVFGDILAIERHGPAWRCFAIGGDGKRGPVDLAIPPEVSHAELPQYLYDIYHEQAVMSEVDIFEIR